MARDDRIRWLAKLRVQHGPFDDHPVECYRCGRTFPRKELAGIEEIPGYRWPRYCPTCIEEIKAAHARMCVLCGAAYMAPLPGDGEGLCLSCSTEDRLRELARVKSHLERARALDLPATLTLGEWLAALDRFDRRCAYCGEPFSDLDHFVPLAAGGGTTAENCVPACARCNGLKGARDPNAPGAEPILHDAMQQVRSYLGALRACSDS